MPIAYAADTYYVACGDATGIPGPVPELTSIAYTLLIIATPIILIIFSIVALVKAIVAGSQDDILKARKKLVRKFLATALVFFVAGIVQFIVTKAASASEKSTISTCLSCFLYNSNCVESVGPDEALTNSNSATVKALENATLNTEIVYTTYTDKID